MHVVVFSAQYVFVSLFSDICVCVCTGFKKVREGSGRFVKHTICLVDKSSGSFTKLAS